MPKHPSPSPPERTYGFDTITRKSYPLVELEALREARAIKYPPPTPASRERSSSATDLKRKAGTHPPSLTEGTQLAALPPRQTTIFGAKLPYGMSFGGPSQITTEIGPNATPPHLGRPDEATSHRTTEAPKSTFDSLLTLSLGHLTHRASRRPGPEDSHTPASTTSALGYLVVALTVLYLVYSQAARMFEQIRNTLKLGISDLQGRDANAEGLPTRAEDISVDRPEISEDRRSASVAAGRRPTKLIKSRPNTGERGPEPGIGTPAHATPLDRRDRSRSTVR